MRNPQLNNFFPDRLTVKNEAKKLHHAFEKDDCYALWAAYSSGRPLLLRGDPGTGKSQMAQAIAEQLGWAFVSEVVQGNTELSDLHWHFDAVARLGEAQVQAGHGGSVELHEALNPQNFLSPGAFWWAYDWTSAASQYKDCKTRLRSKPECPNNWDDEDKAKQPGVVLLLDEIDKAEPDLPNGLLETLGQYQFTVPYLDHVDCEGESELKNPIQADPSRVLVIITTNEERELPRAFVRRCFVHTLAMETSKEVVEGAADELGDDVIVQERHQWLMNRGRLHFGKDVSEKAYYLAAQMLWDDRDEAPNSLYPPGLAEYIDLLTAIHKLKKTEQEERLHKIKAFALQKEVAK